MKQYLLVMEEDLTGFYLIDGHLVKESVNVTSDDTKLPSIQTEDLYEKLKFDDMSDLDSDDEIPPEVVANNNSNNDDNPSEGGGNTGSSGNATNTGEESSPQSGNNSG